MVWLYLVILLVLAASLIGAYRVLGTPSRLAPRDYGVVLEDIRTSVERAAALLGALRGSTRGALAMDPRRMAMPVSYTHLTLPTNREV